MKYIGIDYGSKRIGIATSDAAGAFAFPHGVSTHDEAWKVLPTLIADGVDVLVIGDGRALTGEANAITDDVSAFAAECVRRFPDVRVELVNEAWSSQEAARFAPVGKKHDDSAAAAIILQRYLDMYANKSPTPAAAVEQEEKMATDMKPEISYDDFAKIDVRVGTIVAAERVEKADKLLKCTVDFGALGVRTIVSGIAEWKTPEDLVGHQYQYVVNLAPRVIRGVESQGMLFAGDDKEGVFLMSPERHAENGAKLR